MKQPKGLLQVIDDNYPGYNPVVAMLDLVSESTSKDHLLKQHLEEGNFEGATQIQSDPSYLDGGQRLAVHKAITEYMYPKLKAVEVKVSDPDANLLKVISTVEPESHQYKVIDEQPSLTKQSSNTLQTPEPCQPVTVDINTS
jgi:hypothetical protein